MRGSLRLTYSLVKYLVKNKFSFVKRFPLVLMLEITHKCNLACEGCGRIREFKDTMDKMMSVEDCMSVVDECRSPVITITGGEPLLHPDIDKIIQGVLSKKRHIYLCTNGITLANSLKKFEPDSRLNINVHLDGLAETHDRIVGAKGVFQKATDAIKMAKQLGFNVCTNTTIYKDSDPQEIEELFKLLTTMHIDGILVSPGFSFEDNTNDVFIQKDDFYRKFSFIYELSKKYKILNTPLYLKFLKGERDLMCTPWGNPTRNSHGWKSPCYMITESHFSTFREFMDTTDWDKFESGKDPRCRNCMVHCGFEPTVVLETGKNLRDVYEMLRWSFS
ncbi:MAG: adenosyl-hopene transferase HpnH [Candidatus Scalindua sp. AMX11]|nr:MAG: adenosyl-hopene transferase HpnH [Candidatus Scalindua sp.]NOG85825.1 adenosyl-hopene transferase HpnH [Planctomycetota bacterium]RZV97001.1 MAG: adenosyl-hopene transferase HpnH [Candidatus Scalindua sp. SCAELEC01]TDE66387.1 MAG: adenosyl-hopene transferase HpnH [Candidatus Scalindua sp. AMX11]GJQ58222.1 MAG: hopanoid biosynthesis associated radical SAM protein HpnH [Candidatus Scalindua sp.]